MPISLGLRGRAAGSGAATDRGVRALCGAGVLGLAASQDRSPAWVLVASTKGRLRV